MAMFNVGQFLSPFYMANPTAAISGANQVFSDLRHTKTARDRNDVLARQEDRRMDFTEFNANREFDAGRQDKADAMMRVILEMAATDPERAKTLFPVANAMGITIDTGDESASAPPQSAFSTPVAPKQEPPATAGSPPVHGERQFDASTPAGTLLMTIRDAPRGPKAPTIGAPAESQPLADPRLKQIDDAVNPILQALGSLPMPTPQPAPQAIPPLAGMLSSPLAAAMAGARGADGVIGEREASPAPRAPATAPGPAPAPSAVPTARPSPGTGAAGWRFSFQGKPLGTADVPGYQETQRKRAGQLIPGLQGLDRNHIGVDRALEGVGSLDNTSPEKAMEAFKALMPLLTNEEKARIMEAMAAQRGARAGGTQDRLDMKFGIESFDKAATVRGIKTLAEGQKLLKAGVDGLLKGNGFESLQTLMGAYKQLDPRISDKDMGRILGYQGPMEKFNDWLSITMDGDISPETKARAIEGLEDSIKRNEMLMRREFEGLKEDALDMPSPMAEQGWNHALQRTMRDYGFNKPLASSAASPRSAAAQPPPAAPGKAPAKKPAKSLQQTEGRILKALEKLGG